METRIGLARGLADRLPSDRFVFIFQLLVLARPDSITGFANYRVF